MRSIFTIILLSVLTVGAIFYFRSSLEEALIAVNIEELARHNTTGEVATTASTTQNPSPTETHSSPIPTAISPVEHTTPGSVTEPSTEVNTPPPLSIPESGTKNGQLSVAGVLTGTNSERGNTGALPLSLNAKLTAAAEAKLADMFAKQYFDHIAPDGTVPSDWVTRAGYAYKLTGENLALGDFSGDNDLILAWMNSPGHRANILKPDYTEIGIAVGKGMFNGRETWLAVQVFGKPLPNCTKPSEETKQQIINQQAEIDRQQQVLTEKKAALESANPKYGPEYNAQVDEYNSLVDDYNKLAAETKNLAEEYNAAVDSHNTCIAS